MAGRNALHTGTLKKKMVEALKKTLGIVTDAAKLAKIDRQTHYKWLADDPAYKAEVEAISDIVLDFAESNLFILVKEKNPAAILFLLKCKGRKRGYIEKQEIGLTDSDGKGISIIFKPSGDEPLKDK